MNILPSLEEVKQIAATGEYNVLPVSCEILSDRRTPIETLRVLKTVSSHCYMLESVVEREKWGRYTFLGYDPKLEVTCIRGEMKVGDLRFHTEDPSAQLRQILSQHKSPKFDYLPSFTGGLVGYFSYDYLTYSEPATRVDTEDTESFQDVDLMLFDKVIAFDNVKQKIILIVNMSLEDPETGYNKAVMELQQLRQLLLEGTPKQDEPGRLLGPVTPLFDKPTYRAMVERAKHYIREGDIFQIVLSNRLSAPTAVCEIKDGWYRAYTIQPEDFGFARCEKADLVGGSPAENAAITKAILSGQEKGHKRNAVLLNAGAALYLDGKAETMVEGVKLAARLIDSGAAMQTLKKLIEVSNRPEADA